MTTTDLFGVVELTGIQLPLVNRFYKDSGDSAKASRGDRVFVVRRYQELNSTASHIVAAVRLQQKSDEWWFLRSMCVAPALRGQGVGRKLLEGLQVFFAEHACFCYPFEHLEYFYALAGFELIAPEEISTQPGLMTEPFERYRRQGRKIILMRRRSLSLS